MLPAAPVSKTPKYGSRKGWRPKAQADFGDGGAYPEVCPGSVLWRKFVNCVC